MNTTPRIALLFAAAAALLLTGCGAEKTGSLTTGTAASGGAASTAEPSGTTEPAPAPNPDGKFTHSCDMLLNTDFNSATTGWLVADAELRNTGNVGININVKAVWKQAGSGPIIKVKHVRIGTGTIARSTSRCRSRRARSTPISRRPATSTTARAA